MDIPDRLPRLLVGALKNDLLSKGMTAGICPEKWISKNKDVYNKLIDEYIAAGVECICIPTEFANRENLKLFSLEKEVSSINNELVKITISKTSGKVKTAGCLSSTGKFISIFDESNFIDAFNIFFEQAVALVDAGVDYLMIKDMTSLAETRAAIFAAKRTGVPIFVTMLINENGETSYGSDILSTMICLQNLGISAFGFNCKSMLNAIELMKNLNLYSKLPLIFNINAAVLNEMSLNKLDGVKNLIRTGVQIFEYSAKSNMQKLIEIRKFINTNSYKKEKNDVPEANFVLVNENQPFFLSSENILLSEPIKCTIDMSDIIHKLNQSGVDVITVELINYDDVIFLCQNAHMLKLPVNFKSENITVLEMALLLFTGKAMIDSDCTIKRNELEKLANKYGAIVY